MVVSEGSWVVFVDAGPEVGFHFQLLESHLRYGALVCELEMLCLFLCHLFDVSCD